ncbi:MULTISPECIES: DUF6643 family protein [unclassified Streptomyces]|uniref:DUF6643 family protein n=1 Tax=unclassified Streptomyces TaxID=2593676 RepID=UPI00225880C6|nr:MULTISPECIES: DUF6643 family protein [unclassified Streptomyces]WSP53645.1 hypothetical protein OG306_04020 [Streptomyces sp. NBC_01241]WSU25689.1 hypothetical protein OG508_35350 [Streptomyces sp. NBC_01108]MCX4785038.1 hypothetical protein [Streptomyces sp. NBC_01221]MCX4799022.1 hypothetical protein [Streptomyces sp. NBC_01242]WSJ40214.1 hypothetical protein OG772_32310 [Streptomyces sp. NBC_01321]
MTSPRSTYGGGYYAAPSFPDTPIYDSLVAERGTPQIAPIRVPAAYDTGNSYLPALPAALPALPAAPSQPGPSYGYQQPAQQGYAPVQPPQLQQAPAPYIPQQPTATRGGYQAAPYTPQQQRPAPGTGYEAMRPASPRPAPAPSPYEDPYNRPHQGRGY